jgi:hypothetical protein
MDLTPVSSQIGRDDQAWLGSARGTAQAQSIALVMASFTAGTHYPNGYIPSGTPLGKYTSGANTGSYGPFTTGAADGTQNLAGFLLTPVAAPRAGSTATVVNGALLDSGRVIVAKLPQSANVNAAAQATNPRFVYV